jgi:hypothetical protein
MSILDTSILTITEPSIKLEPFEIVDIETHDGSDRSKNKDKLSKNVGDAYPGIRINGYDFQKEDIVIFELTLDSFIPTLNVTLRDSKGVFTISQYPKDGDALELIIKSKDEEVYKGIRMDFDIVSISSIPVETEEQGTGTALGSGQKYSFNCQAKIPGLLSEISESYGNDISFNHLQTIADNLQLGFASNETTSADEQVRYCAGETRLNCLEREILHSYKDDNSFFVASIDPYYYLNFINLNQQLIVDDTLEDTFTSLIDSINEKELQDTDANKIQKKLLLTNRKEEGVGSAMFIDKYALVNNSGEVFLKNGYKRVVQYYDQVNREFMEFTLDTLTSDNLPDNYLPLKGKSDEDRFETEIKYKYLGIQSDSELNGNVHPNYNYALIQNFQNKEELEKLMLKVILPQANMSLYRYQRVPVAIYEMNATRTQNIETKAEKSGITQEKNQIADGNKTQKPNNPKLNIFYSGFYVLLKIKYIYKQSRGMMEQELTLSRREWPAAI